MSSHKRQSIGRNAIYLTIEPVLFGIIGVFITGYVARTIGEVEYGKIVFALAFINFFTLFTNLGFHNYIIREFSAKRGNLDEVLGSISVIRFVLACITYALAAAAVNILNNPPETRQIVYAASLIVFPLFLTDSYEGVFKGYEKMQYITVLKMVNSVTVNLFRYFVVLLGFKAMGLAWTRVVCASLAMAMGFFFVRKYFLRSKLTFNWKLYKEIITGTLPFAFSTSFLIIYTRVDIIMLSYMKGDAAVAWYKAANIFVDRLLIITVAIIGAVYPAIARLFITEKDRAVELYSRSFLYLFLISLPISVGGIILSEKIIFFVFDEQYINSVPVLQILLYALPVVFATNIMGNVLMATHHAKAFAYIMTVLCITNIVANFILIPYYGHIGAALATLISQVINFIILLYITRQRFAMFTVNIQFFKGIVSAAVMGVMLLYMIRLHVVYLIVLGMAAYVLSLTILRTMKKEELLEIKNMIVGRRAQR